MVSDSFSGDSSGPPSRYIGMPVPLGYVVARTAQLVVTAGGIVAYPSGFELTLSIRRLPGTDALGTILRANLLFGEGGPDDPVIDILYDQASHSTTGKPRDHSVRGLAPLYGFSDDDVVTGAFWVEAIPATSATLRCSWSSKHLEDSVDLDVGAISEAGAKAIPLWE